MFVNTTLLIFIIFLIPSLIFYFYPYKSKTCFDGYDLTAKGMGVTIATLLLIASIIVSAARFSNHNCCNQKTDLSSLISFNNNHKPTTSDVYSTLTKEK